MGKEGQKIALGGGCHWCTEAVFQSLQGVNRVEQGFVASTGENAAFSEAVIVYFDPEIISLTTLIRIHLHTHSSTSGHGMRKKYRSAVYIFSREQQAEASKILEDLQGDFEKRLITRILSFQEFRPSAKNFQNYYKQDPERPFCKAYIAPKIKMLLQKFSGQVKEEL